MAAGNFSITFDVEPIVKLYCHNFSCRFNNANIDRQHHKTSTSATCGLKFVEIGENGNCTMMEALPTDATETSK